MGKYDPWDRFFAELEGQQIRLSLEDFQELTGVELPPSARKHPAWWSNVHYYSKWAQHGWYAKPKLSTGEIVFSRERSRQGRRPGAVPVGTPQPPPTIAGSVTSNADIVLLGCVSQKAESPRRARDLYTSSLWQKRRAYAEATGKPWMILSAEHGLVDPNQVLEPYDRSLRDEQRKFRRSWSDRTAADVIAFARKLRATTVEIHAGSVYIDEGLSLRLVEAGLVVLRPLQGLKIGEQLAWYGSEGKATVEPDAGAEVVDVAVPAVAIPDDDRAEAWDSQVVDRLVRGVDATAGWLTGWLERMRRVEGTSPEQPVSGSRDAQVVEALLRYGAELEADGVSRATPLFTSHEAANSFLVNDDWAFLAAVICDYQILAERAWETPYELERRLGGWSVDLIASSGDEVEAAFVESPALHRFPNQTARWVVEAAHRVIDRYDGDAGTIWSDEPTAVDLQRRLTEFAGISQKKAAMAVELLQRHFGVEIRDMAGSDIAYDVHIRRVMLRSGLAQRDEVDHMVNAARRLHPERPGALDLPMWDIGRKWCRPRGPDCGDCAISDACPRHIGKAANVRGA